jgi:hypothetical protein
MATIASFLRVILAIYIIGLGLEQIYQAGINQKFIPASIDFLSNVIQHNLDQLKFYCMEIIYIENFFFIFTGFLLLFNYKLAKFTLFIAVLMNFVFLNNFLIRKELNMVENISIFLSILGGVLNC